MRAKKASSGGDERRKARDRYQAKVWMERIEAGLKARENYDAIAAEVKKYLEPKHEGLYRNAAVRSKFDFAGAAALSIPKTAQARATLGPRLYQRNPRRVVLPKRPKDGVAVAFARCIEAYLNATPRESGLAAKTRKAIDESMDAGRGFLQVGYDDDLEIVTSWRVRSSDVVIDPDVTSMEEAYWIAVRTCRPVWEVKREFKAEPWRVRGLEGNREPGEEGGGPADGIARTNDNVTYWTIYSKMGSGVTRGKDVLADFRDDDDADDYVKLVVAKNHDVPLFVGEWDVPLYLDDTWPLEPLDLFDNDTLWPPALLGLALSSAAAIDLFASIGLQAGYTHAQERYLVAGDLEKAEVEKLQGGGMFAIVPVKLKPGDRLADRVYRLDLGQIPAEIARERDWHERTHGEITGTTPAITGGADTGANDRSATETQMRGDGAMNRVADLGDRVESFCSRAARNEALAVRLLLDPEEVEETIGAGEVDLGWALALPDPEGGTVPVRATKKLQEGFNEELSLEYIHPPCATYYATPEEAMAQIQAVFQATQASPDPRVTQVGLAVVRALQATQGAAMQTFVRPVTVRDVWNDTKGMSARDLMREHSYEIVAGSIRKLDPQRKSELAQEAMQNVLPVLIQGGYVGPSNGVLRVWYDANEMPEEDRQYIPEMPPPMPGAAPGGGEAAA